MLKEFLQCLVSRAIGTLHMLMNWQIIASMVMLVKFGKN